MKKSFALICACIMLSACQQSLSPVSGWSGKWTGPEGTYLSIEDKDGAYLVTIKDLDKARSYAAHADGSGLRFMRDGRVETIHAGSGPQTGMKWLQDKKECLIVKQGEGYCRG